MNSPAPTRAAEGNRLFLETFGCQMNLADSESIAGALVGRGYTLVPDEGEADVILYNTCSVRAHAEDRVYSRIGVLRTLKARRPGLVIGVLGCMAQREGAAIRERLPHVDLICGTHRYPVLPELLETVRRTGEAQIDVSEQDIDYDRPPHYTGLRRTPFQAYVTVMKGCDCRCTFCIVPVTRGTEASRPVASVVEEVRRLADSGVVEVTLLGQNITSYGKNLSPSAPQNPLFDARPERSPAEWEVHLGGLLRAVHEVRGLERLRFVTGHPAFVTRGLFECFRDLPKLCPYLHVPAQSGSDRILRRMKRGYVRREYTAMVELGRSIAPRLAFASDFIVGFPGETEDDVAQTESLMREVGFHQNYLFKYSPRPGTPATRMKDDVAEPLKKERHARLTEVHLELSEARRKARIGETVEVLVEGPSERDAARMTGRTPDNDLVHFPAPADRVGKTLAVRIERATALSFLGRRVEAGSDALFAARPV